MQGKPDDDGDDDPDSISVGPDVDEDELIAHKNEFERKFILKHRSLFSESLSHDRYLQAPPMHISIKNSPDRSRDPALYHFKPRPIPLNIKPQAKGMLSQLELQGVHSGPEGSLSQQKLIIYMSYIFKKVMKNVIQIH